MHTQLSVYVFIPSISKPSYPPQHTSQQPATQEEMEPVVQSRTMVASEMHHSRLSVGGPRETHLLPTQPADRDRWGDRGCCPCHVWGLSLLQRDPYTPRLSEGLLMSRRVMRNRALEHFEACFSACIHMHICTTRERKSREA